MEKRTPSEASSLRNPVVRIALRDSVYDTLLDMLLGGSLPPGATVSIDGTARKLDVSPTPVREALVHLERTGLVSREALRGYRVAPPLNTDQIRELCQARMVLEVGAMDYEFAALDSLALELAAAHAVHARAAEDLGVVADGVRLAAVRTYFEADWDFHTTLIRHTSNRYLRGMSEQLFPHIHRMRQSVSHGVRDAAQSVVEHGRILAAVEAGDRPAAKRAMRAHLTGVMNRSIEEEQLEDAVP